MKRYFLWQDDDCKGPLTAEEIKKLLFSGRIAWNTPCCEEGSDNWNPVKDMGFTKKTLLPLQESDQAESSPNRNTRTLLSPATKSRSEPWFYGVACILSTIGLQPHSS